MDFDIAIDGASLAGLALAVALRYSRLSLEAERMTPMLAMEGHRGRGPARRCEWAEY